jgi:hypothetical protein|tara:strand:+ start:54 stop:533 length:480 start_codon:yes stop_codon:yes gene_type:complete
MSIQSEKYLVSIIILLIYAVGNSSTAGNLQSDSQKQEYKKYYVEDIKKAMSDHIGNHIDVDGIFHHYDDKTGENLSLKFVKIHDPVRVIDNNTYFACTDFEVVGEANKLYDLDFWLSPVDGVLKVFKTKIHKEPKKSLIYGWYKQPRYTFVDDKVVPLY